MTYPTDSREIRLRFDATIVEEWDILDTPHLPSGDHVDVSPSAGRYSITKIINMNVNLIQLGWVNADLGGFVADVMMFLDDRIIGSWIPDQPFERTSAAGFDPVAINLIEKIRLEANEVFGFAANYKVAGHPMRRYIKDVLVLQVGGPMTKEWKERNKVDDDWYDTPEGDTNPNPHKGKTGDLQ